MTQKKYNFMKVRKIYIELHSRKWTSLSRADHHEKPRNEVAVAEIS